MKEPKVLFVKQFLANLFLEDIKTIPINNEKFNSGIDKMAKYFFEHRDTFGPFADRLEQLFWQYSTKGDYLEFEKVIENFNGRILSLENPYYVKANIKFQDGYERILFDDNELQIGKEIYQDLITRFCEGAGIPFPS